MPNFFDRLKAAKIQVDSYVIAREEGIVPAVKHFYAEARELTEKVENRERVERLESKVKELQEQSKKP